MQHKHKKHRRHTKIQAVVSHRAEWAAAVRKGSGRAGRRRRRGRRSESEGRRARREPHRRAGTARAAAAACLAASIGSPELGLGGGGEIAIAPPPWGPPAADFEFPFFFLTVRGKLSALPPQPFTKSQNTPFYYQKPYCLRLQIWSLLPYAINKVAGSQKSLELHLCHEPNFR